MGYRDEREAARVRREALLSELRTLRARADELDRIRERARAIDVELSALAAEEASARAKVPLPLLSQVRVASPCRASWEAMDGDERARHCGRCDKTVYDLSALTAEQSEALLGAHGESLCVRFYRRRDGTVMTSDCPVGRRRGRVRKVALAAALAVGGVAGAGAAYELLAPTTGQVALDEPVVMGEVAYVPPPEQGDEGSPKTLKASPEDGPEPK